MEKIIYMDNAATTSVHPQVLESMLPFFSENYGNPSSIYSISEITKSAIENSREIISTYIGSEKKEIYFTGGGSESDNWAIKSVADQYKEKGNHIITSKIEHHAVLHTCEFLEKNGFEVTYLDVDEFGLIDLNDLKSAIKPSTILISIMFANNEIGTILPIEEIGKIAKENNVLFHTDAVQAFGQLHINVNQLNIDLLSASAHKLKGPKGVGLLYVRKGVKIPPLIHGGAQERNKRAGTENVPGIVGFGKAVEMAEKTIDKRMNYEKELRDYLIERVINEVPFTRLNGHSEYRLPNNANFSFRYVEGEAILMMLDSNGICASSGSACTSGSLDPSHVLLAIGLPHEIAHGSLRLTISDETTKEDIDFVVETVKNTMERLRSMSPLYEDFLKEQGGK